ncbi:MAG: triose-phosphate isomerase [Simkaniaceae bacterium]|nr:triose-phosphate isomerase [Candidatus Sacchlamyda saccharinae]
MARPIIIAGNWKMHKTIGETAQFIEDLLPQVEKASSKVLIAPPFTSIAVAAAVAKGSNILIGAQNMSDVDEGAFTGEVSAGMLKDAGAQFVILGHSERRQHFGETDEHINRKLKQAIAQNIPAILCIGESEKDRTDGLSDQVLKAQLDGALQGIDNLQSLIIAYEPVWAIGTGKTATPEIAQETHQMIRAHLSNQNVPLLYGGSVKPANITTILQQPDIDGALIGGASLDVESFTQMVMR